MSPTTPYATSDWGWSQLTAQLAALRAIEDKSGKSEQLAPLPNAAAVEASLDVIEELRTLHESGFELVFGDAQDMRPSLYRTQKGSVLDTGELRQCALSMLAARDVGKAVLESELSCPRLTELVKRLPNMTPFAHSIMNAVGDDGALRDDASPELSGIRAELRSLHQRAKRWLEEALTDVSIAEHLQDDFHSIRNDRYVLPIKASSQSHVPGLVHNASQTGQTLFIEPQALIPLGNEIAVARSRERDEELRILQQFSEDLADRGADLERLTAQLIELDLWQARARLANALRAVRPELVSGDQGMALQELRHPLLALSEQSVVPCDVVLDSGQRGLIISGPNAGGKTVTLTAIGFAATLTRCGFPVPCRQAQLPLFDHVSVVMGDAQNLGEGTSTFSAHMRQVAKSVERAQANTCVLIDELASNTDPREGGALAQAVVQELLDRKSTVVVTTHLEELKTAGLTDKRCVNASVAVDPNSQRPTYQVALGSSGFSRALEAAEAAGIPESVVARAREELSGQHTVRAALEALQTKTEEMQAAREQLDAERRSMIQKEQELQTALQRAREDRQKAEAAVRQELAEELATSRAEVADLIASLQQSPSMKDAHTAQKALDDMHRETTRDVARLQVEQQISRTPAGALNVGDRVQVVSLKQVGVIEEQDGKSFWVRMGALRSKVSSKDLVHLGKAKRGTSTPTVKVRVTNDRLSHKCDLRGKRAEEAIEELEKFLDAHATAGTPEVWILHGLGTGALMAAVAEALTRSPLVASFRSAKSHEGGSGITVATMEGA